MRCVNLQGTILEVIVSHFMQHIYVFVQKKSEKYFAYVLIFSFFCTFAKNIYFSYKEM